MPTTTTEAAELILAAAKERNAVKQKLGPQERMKIWLSPIPGKAKISKESEARRLNSIARFKARKAGENNDEE